MGDIHVLKSDWPVYHDALDYARTLAILPIIGYTETDTEWIFKQQGPV